MEDLVNSLFVILAVAKSVFIFVTNHAIGSCDWRIQVNHEDGLPTDAFARH